MTLEQSVPATVRSLDGFPEATWSVAADGLLVGWNRAAEHLFGRLSADVVGRRLPEVLGAVPAAGPVELPGASGRPVRGSVVSWDEAGVRHCTLRTAPTGAAGESAVVGRRLLEGLLEHVSDAIVTIDADGVVLWLNRGAETMYGVRAVDLVGRHVSGLTRFDDAEGYLSAMRATLEAGEVWGGVEVEVTTHAGRSVHVDSAATALRDARGGYVGAVLVSRDVRPVRELEQSLRAATRALRDRAAQAAKATHRDALTGVAARSLLQERLAAALTASADTEEPVCVLAADLDGFRAVNDSYGLPTGDAVLIAFAAHLRSALPPGATAGRLGADEFAVVLPGAGEQEAHRIARLLRGWTPPSPLPTRGRRAADPDVGVTVAVVRATAQECRSPFDTGVRSVLRRAEDALTEGKRS
ncbi:sensor domain-containing diguanylate cyclase [Kineococcus sp. SYSU DK003]|uniref:sensor domain-containing diguanylate cyclase n=1 Tax=Kineococcus sp. SYSU DK003 TaxID=3383124 RepID=UPI003D7D051B